MAAGEVVVDETHGLHQGVAGGGAKERPASFLEILAEGDRFRASGESAGFGPGEGPEAAGGLELEEVGMKAGEFAEQLESAPGIVDGGEDLAPVSHDSGVMEEPRHVFFSEASDTVEIESREGGSEIFPFPEDGEPGEAGLESFEADLFEKTEVIRHFPAPLFVVIAEVVLVLAAPPAAGSAIGSGDQSV